MTDYWDELVVCPVCDGEGYVWYEGTSHPTGDDPSGWLTCPTCKGHQFVRRGWAVAYKSDIVCACYECQQRLPVADIEVTSFWVPDGDPQVIIASLCYNCYNTRYKRVSHEGLQCSSI